MMDRGRRARVVRASTGDVVMTSVDEDADAGRAYTRIRRGGRTAGISTERDVVVDVQSECIGGNIVVARVVVDVTTHRELDSVNGRRRRRRREGWRSARGANRRRGVS